MTEWGKTKERVSLALSARAFRELKRIARRDGVSEGEAAAKILEECLVDDDPPALALPHPTHTGGTA
jgi:hypothetical protein